MAANPSTHVKYTDNPVRLFLEVVLLLSASTFAQTFEDGLEVAQRGDYRTVFTIWRPLAEQGPVRAQLFLGATYRLGNGVPRNYAEAVKWYRKAAELGLSGAQVLVGAMYAKGEGVPEDLVQAYMWTKLAAVQGEDKAKAIKAVLRRRMTNKQVAKAQRLSRAFIAK